jgi:hypothetical protein
MDVVPTTRFEVSANGRKEAHRTIGPAPAASRFLDRHELSAGDTLSVQGRGQPWAHRFVVDNHQGEGALVTRLQVVTTHSVSGSTITLSRDQIAEVHLGAWRYHRHCADGCTHSMSLQGCLVSRILGRKVYDWHKVYSVYHSGRIEAGMSQVWATGGREVIEWALAHTTEYDLAMHDYVDRLMWASHSVDTLVSHGSYVPDHAPSGGWRDGVKMPEDRYRAMLQQVDMSGSLSRAEAQLAELAREAGYG